MTSNCPDYIWLIVAHIDSFIVLLVVGDVSSDLTFVLATLSFSDAPQISLEVRKNMALKRNTFYRHVPLFHPATRLVKGHVGHS